MITVGNERFILEVYKRALNSAYEWEEKPAIIFKGRPANQFERKNYRIQKGVDGGTDSVFVITSNLPSIVKEGDKITFLAKEWTVMSIGYYFDETRFINPGIMNDRYIESRCPKGLNLQ